MKTKKKEEKNEDLANIQKCTHGTVLHVFPVEQNISVAYMHIYTPVEFMYNVFLLDLLLFTKKELSPDSVTTTLSNTKVLEETVFCTLQKFINQKKLYN